jgi:hypothetical protein
VPLLLDDFRDILSSGGVGVRTATGDYAIYTGFLPPAPDKVIALFELSGFPSLHTHRSGAGQPVLEQPQLQVMIRTDRDGYSTGRQKCQAVRQLLDGLRNKAVTGGGRYQWVSSLGTPFLLQRDENNRVVFSATYEIMTTEAQ